jgi:hypothetical protein
MAMRSMSPESSRSIRLRRCKNRSARKGAPACDGGARFRPTSRSRARSGPLPCRQLPRPGSAAAQTRTSGLTDRASAPLAPLDDG